MVSGADSLSPRIGATAIWTGSEMIVWGGMDSTTAELYGDGARYHAATNSWALLTTDGAPSPRVEHTAVWTGSEMIIWGGQGSSGPLGDGARYDPATARWTPLSSIGAPNPRWGHTAAWDGQAMIVWGGWDGLVVFNDAARYNPTTDHWALTANGETLSGGPVPTDHGVSE